MLPPPSTEALLRISGSQQDQVLAARQLLESAVAGRVFEGAGHDDVAVLLTAAGKAFLMGLEAQHSCQTVRQVRAGDRQRASRSWGARDGERGKGMRARREEGKAERGRR
jgi:hypothetical protein